MRQTPLVLICITLLSMFLSFSSMALEPLEVSDAFWKAMQARDRDAVSRWVDAGARAAIPAAELLPATGSVTMKRTIIEGDDARVDTVITPSDPRQDPQSLQTVLRRDQGEWKVDYAGTVSQLTEQSDLAAGVRDLRVLSGDMNARIDEVLGELERELPAVEKEFGDLKRELETRLPELRDRLDEFSRRIDEVLADPDARREADKGI